MRKIILFLMFNVILATCSPLVRAADVPGAMVIYGQEDVGPYLQRYLNDGWFVVGGNDPWGRIFICPPARFYKGTEYIGQSEWVAGSTTYCQYQCPTNHFYNYSAARCEPFWDLGVPNDMPKPAQCPAGNPIDTATGNKMQAEVDIPNADQEGIGFTRYYNLAAEDAWSFSYTDSISVLNPHTVEQEIKKKSQGNYSTKADACILGWREIKTTITDDWAIGAEARFKYETCQIVKPSNNGANGEVVVKTLPLVSRGYKELYHVPGSITFKKPDGTQSTYQFTSEFDSISLDGGNAGVLTANALDSSRWTYTSKDGTIDVFSADGKLVSRQKNGMIQTLLYDQTTGKLTKVTDSNGKGLTFAYTNGKLTSITTNSGQTTSYTYNANGVLVKVTRPDNTYRAYHYEDARFPKALTGITDERNFRYATWKYDEKGRAISSEHYDSAEKTTLLFNSDNSTTVTNSLGKKTTIRFNYLAGQNRVTSVEGQPTENCIGANQNYTYTPEGWLESKTDWKGFKTFYSYNTKGQEISRTEAYGTPLAKTISTEWHSTLNLKTKVTEFNKETTYTYDVNGRLTGQTVKALSAQ